MNEVTNLIRIPDNVKVFAKYMDEGKVFYSRCYFIAICKDDDRHFVELDNCLAVEDPETASNCIGFEIVDEESWLPAEEFLKRHKPNEYDKFMKLMER
jgi:hypothetical protein